MHFSHTEMKVSVTSIFSCHSSALPSLYLFFYYNVPCLRRLATGLPPRRPNFSFWSVHVRLVVDKLALKGVSLNIFIFLCQYHSANLHIHLKHVTIIRKTNKTIIFATLHKKKLLSHILNTQRKPIQETWLKYKKRLLKRRKSKGIPRQAEVALGVPGWLRPRIFSTFGTTRVVGRQPNAPAAFSQEKSLVLIYRS